MPGGGLCRKSSQEGRALRHWGQQGGGRGRFPLCGRDLSLRRASRSGRVPRSVGGARGLGGANGVSGGAGCGRYCRRRGPRDGRSPGRWCWWPPPLPEPEPEPPPLPPRVVASQGGGMLGKGGVGGGGGTKAPKPSFVSYVRPEVRVRRVRRRRVERPGQGRFLPGCRAGRSGRTLWGLRAGRGPDPCGRRGRCWGRALSLATAPVGGSRSPGGPAVWCTRYPGREQKAGEVGTPRRVPPAARSLV